MLSIVELGLSFVYFITFVHDDSSCTFICLFYNDFSVSLRALCSLRDRLFLVPDGMISASWILTLSK